MAHDEHLAQRIREILGSREDLEEKRMFGGVAFLVGGNLAVAASGQGGLLVRADPDDMDSLLAEPGTEPMQMRGKAVKGWLRVEASAVEDEGALNRWVDVGVARSLAQCT